MTVGIYLPDQPQSLPDGRPLRTSGAIHFAGRYRLIDFTLSNLVNSGITGVAIGLGSGYQTLVDHIGSGRDWDLARKIGGITVYPPYATDGAASGVIERLRSGLRGYACDDAVICDAGVFYNLDYRPIVEAHRSQYSDITAIVTQRGGATVPLYTYVMSKSVALALLECIDRDECGMRYVDCIVNSQFSVRTFEFTGYSGHVTDIGSFYRHNIEMLDKDKRNALFKNPAGRVYTSSRDSLPTVYGPDAEVSNSIIADGCQIYGTVRNSVLFRRVTVGRGAIVSDSILQPDTVAEPGSEISHAITDKFVLITPRRSVEGSPGSPLYIPAHEVV
ncbi:MAG: hypothetical protein LBC65_06310 [Oscillospiraceae bacterium]|jgi:glucose-1-phosphate adenylyltransferase|nr:hypothetical protein [Oscillospiraceae bacterium]